MDADNFTVKGGKDTCMNGKTESQLEDDSLIG